MEAAKRYGRRPEKSRRGPKKDRRGAEGQSRDFPLQTGSDSAGTQSTTLIDGEKVEDRVSVLHINHGGLDLTSNHEIRENLRNYMRNTPAWAMFTIGTDVSKVDSMPGVRKTAVVAYRYDQTGRVRFWWGKEGEKPQFDNWVKDPPAKRTD